MIKEFTFHEQKHYKCLAYSEKINIKKMPQKL